MKYAVTWTSEFEYEKECSSAFFYEESEDWSFPYTTAPNNRIAARKFLLNEYNRIDFDDTFLREMTFDCIMKGFIEYVVYGDDVLKHYSNQELVARLIEEIQDYYTESLIWDGKTTIELKNGSFSHTIPGNDEKYVELCKKKFKADKLICLLTEEEIREVYIRVNLANLMVIPLDEF